MPQPKQTKGRCLAQLGGSGPLLLPTLGSGNASPEPVSSQEKAAKASATQLTGDKGRAALKKTLILRPRPSLGLTSTLETQDPYLVNSSFCLRVQTSSVRESLALPLFPELGWAGDS